MTSLDDRGGSAAARARILGQLTERLCAVESGARELRPLLIAGDAAAIDAATARAHNIILEFKLLADEYRRLPAVDRAAAVDPVLAGARAGLEAAATRLARSAAISGGLLERLAALQRGLLALVAEAAGQDYEPSGRRAEWRAEGLRIRESA